MTFVDLHFSTLLSIVNSGRDKTFVVGFDPRVAGFFWLAGQGGYGVQSAPGLVDIATFLITGSQTILTVAEIQSHLEAISPERLLQRID